MKHFLQRHASWQHRLRSLYYTLFCYSRALLIIALCLWSGNFLASLLPIKIPGSILGLLILFMLLTLQIIPSRWVKNGCKLFMQYMTLLFIPAAMGIMDSYPLLLSNLLPILLACLGSTLITLLFVGYFATYLHSRHNHKGAKL